ncbi:response regulator [Pedosphaera parvula]|uniref:Response regulator receiver protein n=1 Tax=Pedosphaera parvula (strain Ellin514) TaxID=320771 RepID=B9XB93_PEDPL|nr:response regulator [Pedosphaera parvula]EEF62778.1 response regulator receiver protein [Pedosphaera parvula Ellin514]
MVGTIQTEPILIAEDNPQEVVLLKMALRKNGIEGPIHIVPNGEEVIKYLRADSPYNDRKTYPFPATIFLDLKMPLRDGFGVLEWLKKHPDCAVIPTIVMTCSSEPDDIKRAYRLGANAYMVKPTAIEEFTGMMRLTIDYWRICAKPEILENCVT